MSDTMVSLRRKINSAGDLQSVVRTMKALAASSLGQYEKSVRALADYYRTVELGLSACFRESEPAALMVERKGQADAGAIGAIVFGSDQGLVGQFNDVVADYAIKTLAALPGKPQVWAVGERVHARLADAGLPLVGLFAVPNSVKAITPLIGQIQIESEALGPKVKSPKSTSSTTGRTSGALYEPVSQRLLPLDESGDEVWPKSLANRELARGHGRRHRDFACTHPRISFRLALPGVRRISRQRKRKPPGGDATRREKHRRIAGGPQGTFHRLRQSGIDEELFDVISGFEAMAKGRISSDGSVSEPRIA